MKTKQWITRFVLAGLLSASAALAAEELDKSFQCPPRDAQAWCYWWWLNGNASKEGITRDMEEMKSKGINGALLFDGGEASADVVPRGPRFMSPGWRELYRHALAEANRCGIVLTVNLCSGWNAGGPWVTNEHAAKKLVSAQTLVKGPGHVSVILRKPAVTKGVYCDIATLAMPVPDSTLTDVTLSASSQLSNYSPDQADDGDAETRWASIAAPTPEKPEYLQFDLAAPASAAGVYLQPYKVSGPKDLEILCSGDGVNFRSLKRATLQPNTPATIKFDETSAKHFRVLFLSAHPNRDKSSPNVQVAEVALLTKAEITSKAPRQLWIRSKAVDLTNYVDKDGKLNWDVPSGTWRVLRIGSTLDGHHVNSPGSGPRGLEIDPMSAEAMDAHFAETGAKLIADAGPLVGKTLQYFHIDSWELGQPTWTPKMREEFQKRRGYDPLPFLPAVLGRQPPAKGLMVYPPPILPTGLVWTVDNPEETARFMQDYRRTIADLVAANYYGRLEELSVKGGLCGTHPESGGPFFFHWIDALECLGRTAVPMGEFWKRNSEPNGSIIWPNNPTVKQAASAAHIYGKPICQAEAYTSFAEDWIDTPWSMKDIGDAAFCEGITRQVLCSWTHQSSLDAKPGFQWAHVGTHFDPNLTWWPMSDAWLAYIARCQYLLRQGLFVADFACLQDEAIPGFLARPSQSGSVKLPGQNIGLPAGFDYDAINAAVLLSRASAKNGRLTLPDGMSYRYLVLPQQPNAILSPDALKKVNSLAESGVTVIGPRVFAGSVAKMRELTMTAATTADGLAPDIEFCNPSEDAKFAWIHRSVGEAEIYFVSNQAALDSISTIAFRVAGKKPELWDAVTGAIRDLPDYREENGRTLVPLQFAPRQSWFVVFRKKTEDRKPMTGAKNFPMLKPAQEISGAWEVQFDPQWFYPDNGSGGKVLFEQLTDWTQRPEEAIKFYSGIASYKIAFNFKVPNPGAQFYLDLGLVCDLARVKLNGQDLGVVWTAPWQVAIPAGLLRPSKNELEIGVANLWPNRLSGDATLPKEQRRTRTNVQVYDKKYANTQKAGQPSALLPSGLLGPVRVFAEQ